MGNKLFNTCYVSCQKSHSICFIVENGENIGRYFEHYYEGIRQTIAFSAKENTKMVISNKPTIHPNLFVLEFVLNEAPIFQPTNVFDLFVW